jgi:DNA-binding phage protein
MARSTKTGFDRYFDKRMKDPTFAAEYTQARAEIDAIDGLIRALDQARQLSGLTKADLARRIHSKPEIVRRLLTDAGGNPTMSTVLKVASALGYHLELVPNSSRRAVHRSAAARARRLR